MPKGRPKKQDDAYVRLVLDVFFMGLALRLSGEQAPIGEVTAKWRELRESVLG